MNDQVNWEKQALESLLNENLKDKRGERRWKTIWRVIWLGLFLFAAYTFLNPFKNKSSSVLGKHTALVNIQGEIASNTPANASDVNSALQAAFENPDSVGVILKINSPGGSPVQSGMIHDEVLRLRKEYPKKHLYVVIEDICASGGYYIAVAGEKIYVDKASLVGSIGVIMSGFGFTGLMDKVGVERRVITAGDNKDMMDPFAKQNPKNKEALQEMINQVHQQFIDVVKQGRGEKLQKNDELFTGMVWNGARSIELGLTDELGTIDFVAKEVIGQKDIIDYSQTENVAERIAKRFGASFGTSFAKALQSFSIQ
ncbi:MAG: signal peptide peptidase SppA [Betaproteobacteria bacterium]